MGKKPKGSKQARPAREPQQPPKAQTKSPSKEMVVFAFRLPAKERDRIHQAAEKVTGKRGGATQFVIESVTKAVEKVLGS